jgi:hypothetical protein
MSRSIYKKVILPLARSWNQDEILDVIERFLIVIKPEAFPAIYDWVSYPICLVIKGIYEVERRRMEKDEVPCPLRLEMLASFERLLCYCHTGNTAVFATSLMNGLGLSRGALKDGFPVILKMFEQPSIVVSKDHGFKIDPKRWPVKNGFPAIASRKAQVLTYSESHFLVSLI